MTPRDFVAALEASGYEVIETAPRRGSLTKRFILQRKIFILDVPGEQWEVFGWCVKELERLGYKWWVFDERHPGELAARYDCYLCSAMPKADIRDDCFEDNSVEEKGDTATGAAMAALASVLEGK